MPTLTPYIYDYKGCHSNRAGLAALAHRAALDYRRPKKNARSHPIVLQHCRHHSRGVRHYTSCTGSFRHIAGLKPLRSEAHSISTLRSIIMKVMLLKFLCLHCNLAVLCVDSQCFCPQYCGFVHQKNYFSVHLHHHS